MVQDPSCDGPAKPLRSGRLPQLVHAAPLAGQGRIYDKMCIGALPEELNIGLDMMFSALLFLSFISYCFSHFFLLRLPPSLVCLQHLLVPLNQPCLGGSVNSDFGLQASL